MRKYGLLAAIIVLLFLPQQLFSKEPRETRRVLVLYSEGKAHPAHELTDKGIRAAFQSSDSFDVQIYPEYMDLSQFGGPLHARTIGDYLRRKYADTRIDLIITVYPSALDFLLEEDIIFPEVPVIACQIPRARAEKLDNSPSRCFVTAVVAGDNSTKLLEDALLIKPGTKYVALVSGVSPTDIVSNRLLRSALELQFPKLELIDLSRLPIQEILRRVGALPGDSIAIYSSIFMDGDGRRFVPREALSLVSQAANAPVFGLYESYLGYGIVGGQLVSFESLGREAATLALRVFGGESPGSIPFGGERAYISLYDWRELERWHIPESSLPPGSEILYRPPSLWRDHKGAIAGFVALMSFEAALILGLLVNLRMRRKAEQSLAGSEERVRLALASAKAGTWSLEMDSGNAWATERTRELFGLTPDEPLNFEKILFCVHPEDRETVHRSMQEAAGSGQETSLEYRVLSPDGNVRWIASRGRLQQSSAMGAKSLMGVSADITERKSAEELLRQHEKELLMLTGRLISTQEEELRRLARELHDDLTQRLAALAMDAGMIEKQLKPLAIPAEEETGELKKRLIDVSEEVHNLSRQLHPAILNDLGLVEAIRSECALFSRRTGITLSFEPTNIPEVIPDDRALCLYRVIQEGLRNIAAHAGTDRAFVALHGSDGSLSLLIQDHGTGFDVNAVRGKSGIGLAGMRERVRLVGGTMSLESEVGKGTKIRISIPLG